MNFETLKKTVLLKCPLFCCGHFHWPILKGVRRTLSVENVSKTMSLEMRILQK